MPLSLPSEALESSTQCSPPPTTNRHPWRRANPATDNKPARIPMSGARKWWHDIGFDKDGLLPRAWRPQPARIHNRRDNITDYYAPGHNAWSMFHAECLKQGEGEVGTILVRTRRPPGLSSPPGPPLVRKVPIVPEWLPAKDNVREKNCRKWRAECARKGVPSEWPVGNVGVRDLIGSESVSEYVERDGDSRGNGWLSCDDSDDDSWVETADSGAPIRLMEVRNGVECYCFLS